MVKEYSQPMFDLCAPMLGCAPNDSRNLFMEGDMRFKDSSGKVSESGICARSRTEHILFIHSFIYSFTHAHSDGRALFPADGYAAGVQDDRQE